MGEADFNQFMRLKNQLVLVENNFARDEDFSPVLIPSKSKDMDEQHKLVKKVVDVVDRAKREICMTLPQYNVDKRESFYAQVRFHARKKEDQNFLQIFYVNYKLEEFIYLFDVMNSVSKKSNTNQRFCNVL